MENLLACESRFNEFVDRTAGPDGCWIWTGPFFHANKGFEAAGRYGKFYLSNAGKRGVQRGAHRIAWMLANNAPIPTGIFVCHRCDRRECVNPSHLFLGTPADNLADMDAKGRRRPAPGIRGEANRHARLTAEDVLAIRASSETPGTLAKRYHVWLSTIADIVSGRTWSHVDTTTSRVTKMVTGTRGEENPAAILTGPVVAEMRRMRQTGRKYREIAAHFQTSVEGSRQAILGETWAHMTDPPPWTKRKRSPIKKS